MRVGKGFILITVLIFLAGLAAAIVWSASLYFQEIKVLNLAISRLHLEAGLDRKITEISEVLSKNAPIWFNQVCACGFCTVGIQDWGVRWFESSLSPQASVYVDKLGALEISLLIERISAEQGLILRINAHAQERGALGHRQMVLLCTDTGCERQLYRKG